MIMMAPMTSEPNPTQATETDLLRAQLTALSQAMPNANTGHSEITLLRDQLVYLQSELERAGPAGSFPSDLVATVEAAIAALLGELVSETERRIRAEQDLRAARLALGATLPTAVAARP